MKQKPVYGELDYFELLRGHYEGLEIGDLIETSEIAERYTIRGPVAQEWDKPIWFCLECSLQMDGFECLHCLEDDPD